MAARQQIAWSQFRKTSFASYAPFPNASSSSLYQQFDNGLLEVTNLLYQVSPPSYKVSQLTSRVTLSYDNWCSNIKDWLCHKLSIPEYNNNKGIKPPEVRLHQVFLSRVKMPDVAVYDNDKKMLVQVEVVLGNNTDRTIKKIAYGLLRWQKKSRQKHQFLYWILFPLRRR